MQLEHGKKYKNRLGEVVTVYQIDTSFKPGYIFKCSKDEDGTDLYTKNGFYWQDGTPDPKDLVEEVKEEATIICGSTDEELIKRGKAYESRYLAARGLLDSDTAAKELLKGAQYVPPFKSFDTGAQKDIGEKLRLDLVAPEMIEALGRGLTYGAKKYSARNWEKGIPVMTSVGAALRHLMQFLKGIDTDEESGMKHIEASFLNLGMVVTQLARGRNDLDDRPNK